MTARVGLLAGLLSAAAVADPPPLPPDVAAKVQEALGELQRGKLAAVHKALAPVFEQSGPDQRKAVDENLKARGVGQSLADLIVDLRVQAVVGGQGKTLKAPGPAELPLALQGLHQRAASLLGPVDRELEIGFRANVAHEVIDETLLRLPDLADQVDLADRLQAALEDALKGIKPADRQKLPKELQPILALNFKQARDKNKERSVQLAERIAEMSMARIPDMMALAGGDRADYKDRFKAIGRLEQSFTLLKAYWPKVKARRKAAPGAGGTSLAQKEAVWRNQEADFPRVAGTLRVKAYHFEQGRQWWLRGRYGAGPFHRGMTKGWPAAPAGNVEALLYYPLRMPDPIPRPADPAGKGDRWVPVPRRHMALWQVLRFANMPDEAAGTSTISRMRNVLQPGAATAAPTTLARALDTSEALTPLVGYVEYQMALWHWDQLLSVSGPAERRTLEDMIAADDRCVVHSFLSRVYDALEPASTLRMDPPRTADPRARDPYERRGLSWCMALARVELQGLRSLLNASSDRSIGSRLTAARPYAAWPPTAFDRDAYAELLADGARQQYYRLRAGGPLLPPTGTVRPQDVSAAAGKVAIAAEMVSGYREFAGGRLLPAQAQEIGRWSNWLDERLTSLLNDALQRNINTNGPFAFPRIGFGS